MFSNFLRLGVMLHEATQLIIISAIFQEAYAQNTDFIAFQGQSIGVTTVSTTESIEFKNKLPDSRELTNCQWIRIKYFNIDSNTLWSYCQIESKNDTMKCLSLYFGGSSKSVNRGMKIHLNLEDDNNNVITLTVKVDSLHYRTWISLCLTISTIRDKVSFYYNGKLIGTKKRNNETC